MNEPGNPDGIGQPIGPEVTSSVPPPPGGKGQQPRRPLFPPGKEMPEPPKVEEVTITAEQKAAAEERAAEAVTLAQNGNLAEALQHLTGNTDEKQQNTIIDAAKIIGEKEELSNDERTELRDMFKSADMKQEHVDAWIDSTNLSTEEKHKLRQDLFSMTDAEKAQDQSEVPTGEKAERIAQLQALGEQVQKAGEIKKTKLKAAGKEKEHSALEKKLEHLGKWLTPEDAVKTWSLRAGKTLYVMFLVMMAMILWEMSVINKAAGKTGR